MLEKKIGDGPSEYSERRLYYLTRSFTHGDQNYHAQMLYGREALLKGDSSEAKRVFDKLKFAEVAFEEKCRIYFPLDRVEAGAIEPWESSYGFIVRDDSAESIYAHISQVDSVAARHLKRGVRLRFRIGFTLRGPQAIHIRLEQ